MLNECASATIISLFPTKENTTFHSADVLYVIAWATTAPGIDGWRVVIDDDAQTSLVSVIPPGSHVPVFFLTRQGEETIIKRQSHATGGGRAEVGRFDGLRTAILALCPLSDDQREEINERMETIYPRSLRGLHLAATKD
jgi:hypothetical protein